MSIRPDHLSFEQLADLAEGRASSGGRGLASAHLAGCDACSRQLASLERVLRAMAADPREDPLPGSVDAVRLAIRRRASEPRPSLVRRVLAALTFESSGLAPAYGLRSAQSGARDLLYNAGEVDVQVSVTPADGAWTIRGQVLGPCDGGEAVLSGEAGTMSAPLTGLCEFELAAARPGAYEIALRLGDTEITIPGILLE
jgi:hypothetical protein